MTEDEAAFVEAMGQYLGARGMTPMSGRMWAWLLICDPPEQTAEDLAVALQASRGAISGTAGLLTSRDSSAGRRDGATGASTSASRLAGSRRSSNAMGADASPGSPRTAWL